MQTFLPYPSYERSADALDPRRLNKQILECVQITKALVGETTSWSNHCVTRMWREAPKGVVLFGLACCKEYRKRPQTRGHHKSEVELVRLLSVCERNGMTENYPRWFNRHKIHEAYKKHLASKDRYYIDLFGVEPEPGYWGVDKDGEWRLYATGKSDNNEVSSK